jgi:FAD dependent oxidoreductase
MLRIVTVFCALVLFSGGAHADETYDVVVYGGTAGGVSAAVQTARMGKRAAIIEPGRHLGGMTSGGLGATDIGNKQAIGGIAREFYQRVLQHYRRPESWIYEKSADYRSDRRKPDDDAMWTFEPHVAEAILREMLSDAKIPVHYSQRLDRESGVARDGQRIVAIKMESGEVYWAKMFIDASYEGDLLAAAAVGYHVGREANATYGETLNGVQLGSKKHQFTVAVDPYVTAGKPESGLLPGVHSERAGEQGAGDSRVQAYNFRMCLTNVPENRVPFPKPAGYDPARYELALRAILAGQRDDLDLASPMPNRKTDTNNRGAISTDNIGMNYDYPDADYATREKIWQEHITYQLGLMWFLANDPRVPDELRKIYNQWGLAKDEFLDTDHWPHQLYVREARRMISDYVMTEHNCRGSEVAADPVGLGAYGMDSHNTQRWNDGGRASNEGDVQVRVPKPYGISYRSIVPKAGQCPNLLVPVCLSASHIAYGSIRMEPVFMVLGQSAASAACQAIDDGKSAQQVDYEKLRTRLLADKQVLQ